NPLARLRQAWQNAAAKRRTESQRDEALRLDEILAKVKASGLGSLTAAERKFLERQSRDRRNGG
ncbi:MAG: hypothetical protein RL398_1089, partial [Planctomycetota bacterium]